MAQCALPNNLIESDRLPMLCMVCGKPASVQVIREFNVFPAWIYVLLPGYAPFLIAYLILRQTRYVSVRFCVAHRHHYYLRSITVPLGLFGIILAILLTASYVNSDGWQTVAGVAIGIGALAWILLLAYQKYTSIRPIEITATDITLVNVHEDYANAVRLTQEEDFATLVRQTQDWMTSIDGCVNN